MGPAALRVLEPAVDACRNTECAVTAAVVRRESSFVVAFYALESIQLSQNLREYVQVIGIQRSCHHPARNPAWTTNHEPDVPAEMADSFGMP